tara:strand:- start:26 stop:244 length:219 start_codon:yes stop_codon:yes gene_type:complete
MAKGKAKNIAIRMVSQAGTGNLKEIVEVGSSEVRGWNSSCYTTILYSIHIRFLLHDNEESKEYTREVNVNEA